MGQAEKMVNFNEVKSESLLLKRAKWLEGKTLAEISRAIEKSNATSRITTKGAVGHLIEQGFFGIKKNSDAEPDLPLLGIEIKTCPLKYNKARDRLAVKEPLSLNIINYHNEDAAKEFTDSSLYKKNKTILFILYIHDNLVKRSEYKIYRVFLWKMNQAVLDSLLPDYSLIRKMISAGKAHEIHQSHHIRLTLCPKHGGKFSDPWCKLSKRTQPYSTKPAEVRAFRLKSSYMNQIISENIGKKLGKSGWSVK